MYFPIPIPFKREYPVILNRWDPLMVCVREVDVVIDGTEEDDDDVDDDEGLDVPLQTLPTPI